MSEWRTKPMVSAECRTCGWRSEAPNAQGNAARHARAHGHDVRCEVWRTFVYDHTTPTEAPADG